MSKNAKIITCIVVAFVLVSLPFIFFLLIGFFSAVNPKGQIEKGRQYKEKMEQEQKQTEENTIDYE